MKLGEKDEKILAHLQHRADLSVAQLAKLTSYSASTVRYCITNLLEKRIIQRRTYINIYPLGFHKQAFFFTVTTEKKRLRAQLLDFLIRSPQIAYVAELGGDYEYKVDLCGRQLEDFTFFLDSLTAKFGDIIYSKAFAVLIQLADFPLRVKGVRNEALTMGIRDHRVAIDDLDHGILAKLSTVAAKSYSEIARELGLSLSTLEYRVKQLRAKKIIIGTRYVIDKSALNMQSFFHLISAKGLSRASRDRLYDFCRRHPRVDYFVQCISSWDYEIGTTVESAQEIIAFTQALNEHFGSWIDDVKTLPLFRYHKVSNYPFLESLDPTAATASWCSALAD